MDSSRETRDDGAMTTSSPSGEVDDDKEMQIKRAGSSSDDDDEGTRQPYKCTFCRRGFPTAQALGGHMNVHRRHRGRSAAAAPATGGAAAAAQGSYEQQPYHYPTTTVAFGQTHPASGAASTAAGGVLSSSLHAERRRPYELRLFGRDCAAAGRGREGGAGAGGDVRRDRCYARDDRDGGDHGGGGEELDLELRLGGAAGP
ncbi:unnamed protein product [Urochloa decumbens]|uniref:C2H2-type domain-containing protein n=1 Tax=Urochloa decumbens TaxID=240449 RepID=A0ABC8ZWT3_9POAL